MSPTTLPQPLALVSQAFDGHCTVTVQSGTNYSHALHHTDVKTQLSLRFEGAISLQIKGLKEQGELVGFELGLTGHSELEQLVLALEAAAATLRAQSYPQAEPPADPLTLAAEPVDRLGLALEQVERRELHVLRLLVLYGEQLLLPQGVSVARHLLHKLRKAPLTAGSGAGLWALSAIAFQAGTLPTQEWQARQWLSERASAEGVALVAELVEEH